MRKVVAMMALLAFMPVAHAADNMNVNAEYRIRYQIDQASETADKDADTNKHTVGHRFKLDAGFKASEKFSAQFTLLHNAQFGDNTRGDSANATPDNSSDLAVNQAYGVWMVNDAWNLKFGRGGFTLADGSVISQNDWQATPYAFEGILANYEHEMFRLSLFGVKADDNLIDDDGAGDEFEQTNGNDDPETNFFGFAIDWKSLPEFLKTANLHLLQVNADERDVNSADATTTAFGKSEMRYGLVLAGDKAGVDYKFNYAAHQGESKTNGTKSDISGNMMAAEVGYSMPEVMKSRFHVAYHKDTGDDDGAGGDSNEYDAFFYEKHGAAGMMDVIAWGNLTFIKAGYTLSPMDQVDVGIHYWKFTRTETDGASSGANGGINGGYITGTTGDSDDIGSEIDLAVTKKYDNGFSVNAWIGMFMPGKYVKDNVGNDDTYNQVFVEGKMTF